MLRSGALPCLAILVLLFTGRTNESRGQDAVISPNLANSLGYVNIGVKAGRVGATSSLTGRSFNSSTQSNDRREQMRVDMTGGAPTIHYEQATAIFQIILDLQQGNSLRIVRAPVGDSPVKPLEFQQPAEGKITIKIGTDSGERTIFADSVWHLFLAEPELARTEIEPLLRLLKPSWPLAVNGQAVEQALYRQVDAQRRYDRDAWNELIEQLGSKKYIERLEADRRLRELGQVVVPYLRSQNARLLDAEQNHRIRSIVRSYGNEKEEDTPDSAAEWLNADPEIWYALAKRANPAQRAKIRTQLTQILGQPIVLDDDAKEDALRDQLAKIRSQIDAVHAGEATK